VCIFGAQHRRPRTRELLLPETLVCRLSGTHLSRSPDPCVFPSPDWLTTCVNYGHLGEEPRVWVEFEFRFGSFWSWAQIALGKLPWMANTWADINSSVVFGHCLSGSCLKAFRLISTTHGTISSFCLIRRWNWHALVKGINGIFSLS